MASRSTTRRWFRIVGVLAITGALGFTQAEAGSRPLPGAAPQLPTVRVEAVAGERPSLSTDGRWVVYSGAPAQSDNRTSTVYLRDRLDASVVELTPIVDGVQLGDSVMPALSADGCVVVVVTQMSYDLFRDNNEGDRWDVYRLVLPSCGGTLGDWELVSASTGSGFDAAAGDDADPTSQPAISATGAVVAYTHSFDGTPLEDATNPLTTVSLVDETVPLGDDGHIVTVPGAPSTAPATSFRYRGLRDPSLSDDGMVLAYTSDATSTDDQPAWADGLTPGGFGRSNVFAWDRADPNPSTAVTQVSGNAAGVVDGDSGEAAVSADGRYIAFTSASSTLVAEPKVAPCVDGVPCATQVYRFDRSDGSTVLVSKQSVTPAAPSQPADGGAWQPAITADGGEVVFVTRATNLFPTRGIVSGGPTDGDIVVAEVGLQTVKRVSVLADGFTPAPVGHSHPQVSGIGRVVVFDTLAGSAFGGSAAPGRQVVAVQLVPTLEIAQVVDVGTVAVTFPGPEWYVSVINRGPSAFLPATVESDNPDFTITGGDCLDGVAVPPGGHCSVNLMLTPTVPGPRTGTLTVSEAGVGKDHVGAASISAQLLGYGGEPTLAPSPAGVDFPDTVVGSESVITTVQIKNVAFIHTTVSKIEITGANPDDFSIKASTCGVDMESDATCSVDIAFAPKGEGHRTATIAASTGLGQYTTVLVNGEGFFHPEFHVVAALAPTGSNLGVWGKGFAPNATVTIVFADSTAPPTTLTTDALGGFLWAIPVGRYERPGIRTVVAQTSVTAAASATVTIVSPPARPTPASPAFG